MTVSTEDCRKFIVNFQKRNPHIEQTRFGGELDEEAVREIENPKNWKRQHKVNPSSETNDHDPVEVYTVYIDGVPVNRHAEGQAKISADKIIWERRFNCEPFDGQIAYLVLETYEGKLLMGNYVGD